MNATAKAALVAAALLPALPALAQMGGMVDGQGSDAALRRAVEDANRARDFRADQSRRDRAFDREQDRMAEERDRTRRDVRRSLDDRDPERRR